MSLNDKIESALVALITNAAPDGVTVLPGKDANVKALPCVICTADGDGADDPPGTGNFWFNASVVFRYSACDEDTPAEAKAAQQAAAVLVFSAIMIGDLAAQLTAAGEDLTVFYAQHQSPESGQDEAGAWVETLPIRLYACNSALP